MMKIGYFADGPWAHETFKLLIADKRVELKFICVRYNSQDNTLKEYAKKYQLDYLRNKNVNSTDFLSIVKQYDCDLFISMSFDQIFKNEIINMPRWKFINCHAGKLPFYRGRNVLNWALINDEKEFGITVHYIDTGIDTGDIILQKTYLITDQDDYNSLLHRAYGECANVLYEAVLMIMENKVKTIKQKDLHPVGFYCTQRKEGDEHINWNQTSRDVFNFIRAICKPGPVARSILNNQEIMINKSNLIANAPCYKNIPGAILAVNPNGFIVKTKDSILEIKEYIYEGKLRMGDRLK